MRRMNRKNNIIDIKKRERKREKKERKVISNNLFV